MGDGENFCLTKPKTLEVPVCSLAGSRLVANCLERWSNPIGGLMIRSVELNQGLTDGGSTNLLVGLALA